MASVIERFALLERCGTCNDLLPVPPAPRACARCGAVKITPRSSEWPRSLKTFLILQYAARHLFPEWRSMQDCWELLLRGNYEGKRVNGRITKHGASPDELYAVAVTDAEEWRTSGATTAFL